MVIDMAFANGVMCHEFCADYEVILSVKDKTDTKSCNVLNVNIFEINDDEKEEK